MQSGSEDSRGESQFVICMRFQIMGKKADEDIVAWISVPKLKRQQKKNYCISNMKWRYGS